jgi:hypothetical protein
VSAETVAREALAKAAELGVLDGIAKVLGAILSGKPDVAERLARNTALAAGAKLAAKERIKRTKR